MLAKLKSYEYSLTTTHKLEILRMYHSQHVKEIVVSRFFKDANHGKLRRSLHSRTKPERMRAHLLFPYKAGVLDILDDLRNCSCATYHSDAKTALGFEFFKRMFEAIEICSDNELAYLNEQVNKYVADKSRDFAPLLAELDLRVALAPVADEIAMGDVGGLADLRIKSAGAAWDVECKSVRFGYLDFKETTNLCNAFANLDRPRSMFCTHHVFSAWLIRDVVRLKERNCSPCFAGRLTT